MSNTAKGIFAGFIATLVISVFMLMKQIMVLMPELDPIRMLADMAGASSLRAGWIMHFMIGSVAWGLLYSFVQAWLPGGMTVRGILFGMGAWLLIMVVVMPMAGAGLFALGISMAAPIVTLVLHIMFGAVLGAVYGPLAADGHSMQDAHSRAH